ncbi:MAG: glycosyltransferase family 2 protein [Nanoarchaeota archaeon]|nr:glycosyltransferase family 2 protein [Nanoarchaeota archaeon]
MTNRKKSPLISVIIPTYNSKVYLKRAVKSVLNQTYKNLEIYVIDDGSTDQTRILMKRLISKDKRINYVKIKHSGLPSVARNAGLKKASVYRCHPMADSLSTILKNMQDIETFKKPII